MIRPPRVALFADSFHEVNGVGLTCRQFVEHARRRGYPLLSVHAGPEWSVAQHGSVTRCELPCSRWAFALEQDLRFDLLFLRHLRRVRGVVREFAPDVIHVTGPNHAGLLGMLLAHQEGVTVAASWHTNVHEYAGRRLPRWMPLLARRAAEAGSWRLMTMYYALAKVLFAPNPALASALSRATGKPCRLMRRGVDCRLFDPARRRRRDGALSIGYVGRLSSEKSVRRLAALASAGRFRIEIAGHGSERQWLRDHIPGLVDHGLLRGEPLADVYANFDLFAFPSETDTYGNVVQEAMASGVPCVVMAQGGPAHIVSHGHTGLVCEDEADFVRAVLELSGDEARRARMGAAARHAARQAGWEAVFDSVYEAYLELENRVDERALPRPGLPGSVVAERFLRGDAGGLG